MKTALYARVSTSDQNCEAQLRELRAYAQARAWEVAQEYVDFAWSGAKAERPELRRLIQDARKRRFDAVLVWKLDRFGRSVLNLVEGLQKLSSYGVRFIATSQAIDTDERSPTSKLILWILAAVAEFEREMVRERVAAGLKSYRDAFSAGRIGRGRPRHSRSGKDLRPGRPVRIFDRSRALAMRNRGLSLRQISRELGVSEPTVRRALKRAA